MGAGGAIPALAAAATFPLPNPLLKKIPGMLRNCTPKTRGRKAPGLGDLTSFANSCSGIFFVVSFHRCGGCGVDFVFQNRRVVPRGSREACGGVDDRVEHQFDQEATTA